VTAWLPERLEYDFGVVLRWRMSMSRETGGLMTACTQPGCTGTIVDGYCDVCGSPAGAAPLIAAAATASQGSLASTEQPNLTAVRREMGLPAEPRNEGLNTACTQPGCTGRIVDRYCDVCGSPAGAVPYVPAATSAASSAHADERGSTAVGASTSAPAADEGRELAEVELNGAQDYRTRVQEAQLPDDVREAALCEIGKLERTNDQSSESSDIRTWLDTILELPWGTRTTDWMDIHGSREVEATLRRLIEPTAAHLEEADTVEVEHAAAELQQADTVEVEHAAAELQQADTAPGQPAAAKPEDPDTAQVQPVVADLVKATTPPAGTHADDAVAMPAVEGRHPLPQLPEQQVLERETPAKKRRIGYLALAATVMAALLIGALLLVANRDRGVTAQSVPTVTATATATATKPTSEPTIQLEDLPNSAEPFQTVRIEGRYPSGPNRFLQVQRWEGGEWLAFPLHPKTDKSGRFTAFVEPGPPGRYRLRLLDPESGVTSETFVLVIKG
jgi:hypothetical protein